MGALRDLFSRGRRYRELAESMRDHLAERIDELVSEGMTRADAELAAKREFGNVTRIEEQSREVWQWPRVESLWADVKYALRGLAKAPGFTAVVIVTMALGIGANTAIFTLVHEILMRSLPVGDPGSLVRIGDKNDCCLSDGLQDDSGDFGVFSWPQYQYLRETTPEFESLAAVDDKPAPITVRRGSEMAQVETSEFVSGNYFSMLRVGAFAGRTLTDNDDRLGAAPAAVMSYQAWQADFGGDPSVVGATLYLQSEAVTVVGIAPRGFFGDRISNDPPALWVPLSAEPLLAQANSVLEGADDCWLYALGRVRPGVAMGALQQKIGANLRHWLLTQDAYVRNGVSAKVALVHVVLTSGGAGIQDLQRKTGTELYLLLAISGFVLLVACANVANLLLARGTRRKAEISMRIALGAGRARLMRQMLTESVVLACLGGAAGVGVAYAGARAILALAFPESPHMALSARASPLVLGFAFLLSLLTGVVFGVVPAWITSEGDPAEALRGGGNRSAGEKVSWSQRSLIVMQAALSVVLLMSAGLLTRSLRNLEHQNFGFETANRYVLHLDPQAAGYKPEELEALDRTLEERLAALSGVENAGLAIYSPLDGNKWTFDVTIPGSPAPGPNEDNDVLINRVSPGYLAAVGQRVVRGRGLTDNDTENSQFVAVVNEAFVKKFFPGEEAIGRHFGIYDREDFGAYEIVGVVADAKYTHPWREAQPMLFNPLSQWQHGLKDRTAINLETQTHYITSAVLSLRGGTANLYATVENTLAGINPKLTVIDLRSFDSQLAGNFNQERVVARLTMLFGVLALVLASVGLYGITSYQVGQRRREIGLRMAFGADRRRVVGMVMRSAILQVGLGLVGGVPVALAGAHAIASQLYEVRSWDPASLGMAIAVMAAAGALAGWLPARRAASVDPVKALRAE